MYAGSIDTSDVLLNRGLNGAYAGFGAVGFTPFAGDGSAVNANVRGNRDIQLLEGVNRNSEMGALTNTVVRGHEFLTDRINQQFNNERFSSLERLLFAQQNDAQRDRTEILRAVDAVKCCCEKNGAKIDNLAALSAKDLEITKLQLQLSACQNSGPGQGN